MFKLSSNTTFKRQVTVVTPTDTGDTKGTFTAQFRRLPQSRVDEVLTNAVEGDTDRGLLDEILVSVEGIADAEGNELPSSEETLKAVMDDACARVALVASYFDAIQKKNARKN